MSKYADTSKLRFGSVQNLYLELETLPLTELFRSHPPGSWHPLLGEILDPPLLKMLHAMCNCIIASLHRGKNNVTVSNHLPTTNLWCCYIIGGSRGGVRDARPPLGVQILSISCSFRENLACSRPPWRVHAPPLGKILDPPLYIYIVLMF